MPKIIKPKTDKLNLGCGTDIKKSYLNLDMHQFKGVDVVWNINKAPWPFPDNSFREVLMSHVLEHVDDVTKTMEEVWRVSKPDAIIKVGVPYFTGLNAVKDPTHKHFFCAGTFDFFEKGKTKSYFEKTTKADFKILKKEIIYSKNKLLKIFNPLINLNQLIYERFFSHIFPAQLLEVILKVRK